MKQRRHTPEQVIRKLREGDRMLGEGKSIAEVCKALEVSEPTYHRWRNQYGGMKADDAKRLKELERENAQLKRIVADQALQAQALKELAKGTSEPGPPTPSGPACAGAVRCQRALGMQARRPAPFHASPSGLRA